MTTSSEQYQPISCDFHDRLEAHATTRKTALIVFRDGDGQVRSVNAVVTDVYAQNGADYLTTSTGQTLRLDQLIEVDGVKVAGG